MTESVVIRKLPVGVKQALRERAAAHGRSLEAEARAILVDVVFPHDFVVEWIDGCRDLPAGDALELPSRGEGWRPEVFE
ncbi:MAG: Arc family DNA-binding protein [Nocardioidaceae bacterium]|nr:Arc family DNA-binding protein [Nocardioidaceae bacterium]MCL2612561.1 Arc family DNA-binding protein [Nocardioidaceae bacterium]